MRRRRSPRGFTLIEIMIAVAIVGILAAIAIPQYNNYILRAKQTEGMTMIGTIKVAQETHLAGRDCYVAVAPNPPGAVSPDRRTWDFTPTPAGRPCSDVGARAFEDINVRPAGALMYYQYGCTSRWNGTGGQTDEYSCSMVGDLDGDGALSEIIYCTDRDGDDACIPSLSGVASRFPFDPVRVSSAVY